MTHVAYQGRPPTPRYPDAALRRGQTGKVVIRVVISPQGNVVKATVERSSGHALLDAAALDAVRRARFRPYTENGVAYSARADIPIDFVL
ncbi:MAG TPA: energy transducer TonB [Burkholderiaceae bacterium]|nr:energy transducer TonB [Burkholderiaceae bacterium]